VLDNKTIVNSYQWGHKTKKVIINLKIKQRENNNVRALESGPRGDHLGVVSTKSYLYRTFFSRMEHKIGFKF
jgi:hypothetical protein